MKKNKPFWILGALAIIAIIVIPIFYFLPREAQAKDDPWAHVPVKATHVDHKDIIQGPLETSQQVTLRCLECHPDAANQVMATSHWTWESQPFDVPWRDEPVTIGKANQLNNFCISAQGNQKKCMSCHIGVDWQEGEQPFDYSKVENVDCLACHADKSTYSKGDYGNPAEGTDLLAAARSVKAPDRTTCGACHFNGGGGNNVKHGDLDESLYNPTETTDVHMGRYNLVCTDCHQTEDHVVKGRLVADNYTVDPKEQVACTDCHNEQPHDDERINGHTASVACQTCHIPTMANKNPTKLNWDWSTAGQDKPEDHFTFLKIKGDFVYDKEVLRFICGQTEIYPIGIYSVTRLTRPPQLSLTSPLAVSRMSRPRSCHSSFMLPCNPTTLGTTTCSPPSQPDRTASGRISTGIMPSNSLNRHRAEIQRGFRFC